MVATGAATAASAYALAPALPSTHLGQGAAHGATDLTPVRGIAQDSALSAPTSTAAYAVPATSTIGAAGTAVPAPNPAQARLAPPGTEQGGERTTSMTSITAISRGHEGDRHVVSSPLAQSASVNAPAMAKAGRTTTTTRAESTMLKDQAPGMAEDGVGHPSTRGPETTREPGTYPKADLHGPHEADKFGAPASASATKLAGQSTGPTAAVAGAGAAAATGIAAGQSAPSSNANANANAPIAAASGGLGNAGTITGSNDSPRTSTVASSDPPQTPKSPSTTTGDKVAIAGNGNAHNRTPTSATAQDDKDARRASGASSKRKSGFFGKIKEKLKHHGGWPAISFFQS